MPQECDGGDDRYRSEREHVGNDSTCDVAIPSRHEGAGDDCDERQPARIGVRAGDPADERRSGEECDDRRRPGPRSVLVRFHPRADRGGDDEADDRGAREQERTECDVRVHLVMSCAATAPKIITNNAGSMQTAIGKVIFTGSCAANSSARVMRCSRASCAS